MVNKEGRSMLRDIISPDKGEPRFLFFSGKGGVGKTTISAATAVWLSHYGYRTLIISTDLQKSLNDIYQQDIEDKPTPINRVSKLWAVSIETAESMERHRGKIMKTIELFDPNSLMLKQMKDDRLTDCGCAQASVFEFTEYLNSNEYDVVVFDTAPAGSTLEKIETQSRSILNMVQQIEVKQKLKDVLGEDGFDSQIAALEEIRKKDETAFENLRSNKTVFSLILIPEALPFEELKRNIEDLEGRYQIMIKAIVINNILPETERKASDFWRETWGRQEKYIRLTHETFSKKSIGEIPLLSEETVGLKQLQKVGDILYDGGKRYGQQKD